MVQIYFENHSVSNSFSLSVLDLKQNISKQYGLPHKDLYVTINGKIACDDLCLSQIEDVVRVCTRVIGGKGGFGSMLRAIGAQIEKTTNREACRDLSGRRLRDINEEKRLRKWLEGQEDRERDAVERKQKKLERLVAEPNIDVQLGSAYEKERQDLPERVSAAVEAGWLAAGSSKESNKRKVENAPLNGLKKAKWSKLWIDAELSDCSSLSEDDEEQQIVYCQTYSTDSGNESDRGSISSNA